MDGPPDLGATVRNYWAPLVRQIQSLEMPVICAVNGVAAGAGSSVALACDMVIAAESAKFIQGVCNKNGELIILVEFDKMLSDHEWAEIAAL